MVADDGHTGCMTDTEFRYARLASTASFKNSNGIAPTSCLVMKQTNQSTQMNKSRLQDWEEVHEELLSHFLSQEHNAPADNNPQDKKDNNHG